MLTVGAIYTFFAGLQWWAIRTQAKIAADTAEAAKKSAEAAEESNRHAREMANKELRAYVQATNVRLSGEEPRYDSTQGGTRMVYNSFDVTFRNTGRTPAYDAIAQRNWRVQSGIDAKLPNDFTFPERSGGGAVSRLALGPGLDHHITFSIDQKDVELARHGQYTLFVYGDLKYTDVFEMRQTTPFCFFYIKEVGREGFAMYETHNDPT